MRPTVEQCLASPYFDKVRQFSVIKSSSNNVVIPIEEKTQIRLKELRIEFQKIVNDYQQSTKSADFLMGSE